MKEISSWPVAARLRRRQAFSPDCYLTGLPAAPRDLALDAGVKHVRLGNEHLLRE